MVVTLQPFLMFLSIFLKFIYYFIEIYLQIHIFSEFRYKNHAYNYI